MDKQPEFTGWADGLSPWEPVLRDGKLYGRGGADDGYAVFSSLTAIRLLQEQKIPHARCVVLIEACEESGSYDLPALCRAVSQTASARRVSSSASTQSAATMTSSGVRLRCAATWSATSSSRGSTEGVHSGAGTGIAPSVFRIARTLLARVESDVTGDLLIEELTVPIPAARIDQARAAAAVLGAKIAGKLPFVPGARALSDSPVELRAQQHLASDPRGHRSGGPPGHGKRRQRPAAARRVQAFFPPAADRRCRSSGRGRQEAPGSRPALWRPSAVRRGLVSPRLGRAARRGLARDIRCARLPARLSARMRCTSARAAASRSSACWANGSRKRSSS